MIIGLTGGIGSGKSTVAQLFEQLGVSIIDADKIAREIVEPKQPALKLIEQKLGKKYLTDSGTLDRPKLRHDIFQDDNLRKKLEGILHPLIKEQIMRRIGKVKGPYCIIVIPLLAEHYETYRWLHRILVVDASESLQIARTKNRDSITEKDVQNIIKKQATREHRLKLADDVIHNTQDIDHLTHQVKDLHQTYLKLASHYL